MYTYTSQRELCRAFWREYCGGKPLAYRGLVQNALPADIRVAFCDWIDAMQRSGRISERLADRVTLI